jgi:endonuclease YncB( thermonuclease family)
MKHLYTFLCLFLLTSFALADITGKAYVTDGDTIKISGTKIRLHGIDSPEAKKSVREMTRSGVVTGL